MTALLSARGLTKEFPGVRALDDVAVDVHRGEVLGLIGENGAGKSTLIKAIFGIVTPDAGEITWEGEVLGRHTPSDAMGLGIELIPQELVFAPELSVAESMFTGRYPSRLGRVGWRRLHQRAAELAARLNLTVDLRTPVGELSAAEQRLVLIARALGREARLLIMDEPTVSLSASDVELLLDVVRDLKAHGVTVMYVSHHLDEIDALTDRVVIMRDGRVVAERETAALHRTEMVELIVGRPPVAQPSPVRPASSDQPLLEVRNLSTPQVHDVSLQLFPGQILGLGGLVGSGRTEVLRAIYGADHRDAGEILVAGRPVKITKVGHAIDAGIALLTEDRHNQGALRELSVASNITIASLPQFATAGLLRSRSELATARRYVGELRIATPSARTIMGGLSGGNQQKVLFARSLLTGAKVFFFDEPTIGIDVGAKAEIYELIRGLAREGAGVVLVSSELEEMVGLCHDVIVMREGRVVGRLSDEGISHAAILELCYADHQPAQARGPKGDDDGRS